MFNILKETTHLIARRSIAAVLLAGGAITVLAVEPGATPINQVSRPASAGADGNVGKDFSVTFVDVAQSARLTSPIIYGGLDSKKYIIETNGCGVAFLDYDNDGWMDVFLLNGTRLEGFQKERNLPISCITTTAMAASATQPINRDSLIPAGLRR